MATAAFVHQEGTGRRTLPIFNVAGNKQLWELGLKVNWDKLEDVLKPMVSDDFWVESQEEEGFVDDVRRQFDRSKSALGYGIVHTSVNITGGDNGDLLQRLLSMGVDPDLPSDKNWRPSHVCGSRARPNCAAAIAACRPDISKKNENSHTVLEAAKTTYKDDDVVVPQWKERRPKVVAVFEELVNKGRVTIAHLASDQKWWAVKNLVRRKVVPEEEMFQKFQGKDAIGWAKHHGLNGLARELEYYFITKKAVLPLSQVVTAIQASASFDSTKKSFGEAIIQLEPLKTLVGKTDATATDVSQLKKQVDVLENTVIATKIQEQRFQEMEKALKRFETMEAKFQSLEEENKSLKEEVQGLKGKLDEKEKESEHKLNEKVKEFKKLFEDLGEGVVAMEGKTKEGFATMEEKMEELKTQQRKDLKRTAKDLEGDMKELEDKIDGFRSDTKKKMRGLGKELEKLKKGGEDSSSGGDDES